MYLYSLNQSDNRNRQVKNGMLLGEVSKSGDYHIVVESDYPGTFYAVISNDPISNWTSSSFGGWSKSITETNKEYTIDMENIPKTDSLMWICYLPSDTSKFATLKVKDYYVETDE